MRQYCTYAASTVLRFNAAAELPVRAPFRCDLTVDALRRLAANVVDVVAPDGAYYRVLRFDGGLLPLRVHTEDGKTIVATTRRAQLDAAVAAAQRMLGAQRDLREWQRRTAAIPWLARLARELRGLKPPRYGSLFEACAHAIVFQQISIHAAASIMRRFVLLLGEPLALGGAEVYAFPAPEAVLAATDDALRTCGLSRPKMLHLRSAAQAVVSGEITESGVEALTTPDAAQYLTRVRGLGPWSAAVVLLRGFGRLDTFPLKDSGVARSLRLLSGEAEPDAAALLEALGPVRGMLYYHLLLGRLRNLLPETYD